MRAPRAGRIAGDLVDDHRELVLALRAGRPLTAREACLAACFGIGRFRYLTSEDPPSCRVGRWNPAPNEVFEELGARSLTAEGRRALALDVEGDLAVTPTSPRPEWDGEGPRPLDRELRDAHVRLVERLDAREGDGRTPRPLARDDVALAQALGVGRYLGLSDDGGSMMMEVGPPGSGDVRLVELGDDAVALDGIAATDRMRSVFRPEDGWETVVDASTAGESSVRIARRGGGPWATVSARHPLARVVVWAMVAVLDLLARDAWPPRGTREPAGEAFTVVVRDVVDDEIMSIHVTAPDLRGGIDRAYRAVHAVDDDPGDPEGPGHDRARLEAAYPLVATFAGHIESLAGRLTRRGRDAEGAT